MFTWNEGYFSLISLSRETGGFFQENCGSRFWTGEVSYLQQWTKPPLLAAALANPEHQRMPFAVPPGSALSCKHGCFSNFLESFGMSGAIDGLDAVAAVLPWL